jgi:CDGSH-type Zn-finger protein
MASMTFTSGLLEALGIAGRSPEGAAGERPAVDYTAERGASGAEGAVRAAAVLCCGERQNPSGGVSMAVKITIRPNGPYLVEGEIELVDVNGNKVDTTARGPRMALCRCGASVTKPFCDGTHSKIGFQAAEAAVAQEKK